MNSKERRKILIASGVCIRCTKNNARDGITHCEPCAFEIRTATKKRKQKRAANHQCRDCGTALINKNFTRCLLCRKSSAEWDKKKRDTRKEMNLCIVCGEPKYNELTRCTKCRKRQNEALIIRREKRLTLGLCCMCGKEKCIGNSRCCVEHFLKQVCMNNEIDPSRWNELRAIFNQQNGICPYTGLCLALGTDASLDHKFPLSKGGDGATGNLQWIYMPVNLMKHDQTEDDFLNIIKLIYNRVTNPT